MSILQKHRNHNRQFTFVIFVTLAGTTSDVKTGRSSCGVDGVESGLNQGGWNVARFSSAFSGMLVVVLDQAVARGLWLQ